MDYWKAMTARPFAERTYPLRIAVVLLVGLGGLGLLTASRPWHHWAAFVVFLLAAMSSDYMEQRLTDHRVRLTPGVFVICVGAIILGPAAAGWMGAISNLNFHKNPIPWPTRLGNVGLQAIYGMLAGLLASWLCPQIAHHHILWFYYPLIVLITMVTGAADYALVIFLDHHPLVLIKHTFHAFLNTQPVFFVGSVMVALTSGTYLHDGLTAMIVLSACLLAFFLLSGRLNEVEYELRQERDRARRYLMTAATPMLVLDPTGAISFVNPAATEMLEYPHQELLGLNFFDVVVGEPDREERRAEFECLRTDATPPEQRDIVVLTRAGRPRTLDWSISALRVDDEFAGVVVSGRDVTEQRQAEQLKEQVMAMVSHDLRSPVGSIVGYLDMIQEGAAGEVPEEMGQFLAIIDRNSKRILRLVDDLLVSAQVEAGSLQLSCTETDLRLVIEDSHDATRLRAEQANVDLQVIVPDDLPLINADAQRLGQVFDNLLSNAVKYTPGGGTVTLRAQVHPDALQIDVSDTGIGIAPEDLERLFGRFFRAQTATQAKIPGVGLGLVITKAIVEGHGGQITVTSQVGEGTTFSVRLPRS